MKAKYLLLTFVFILIPCISKAQIDNKWIFNVGYVSGWHLGSGLKGNTFEPGKGGVNIEVGRSFDRWIWIIYGTKFFSNKNVEYNSTTTAKFYSPYYTEFTRYWGYNWIHPYCTFGGGLLHMRFENIDGKDAQYQFWLASGCIISFSKYTYLRFQAKPYLVGGNQFKQYSGIEFSANLGITL